ncbi:Phycobilisome 31.8 kDa linker polypeptide, phycoerythrin-associated, rod [Porphyridium purpureum]|uniref:Phycobilisome 31.8 kDa linker polypeptide, phycoerythrin-associated, rod n=1 Tax=Porphyridium purpureum TaxID=35688 RepID=A0A5J4YI31_PORPP|nr:Chain zE, LRC3 [Porphyridium purpureum]6KGX_zG Chain zG, LRC3 [Porphyridium purpureum]7EZX_zJ Chain zJ, Phycobilisome 31.8 kDa linker polypeptide, phycoerythrin-associated, rod [Porphyridium purpureum]7EZX_zL Chain zL, Phycobilisome 31.8 kDa linker polypeptide, phycoerythrin-associated, rod [Porphyridium purpureum]7Y4L_z8 Chain z8, Phycobilisome 31.8 kDa linker polypeptide, phycoerythrin-associated, rod [Porphyridium purpureum]7Y4L_zF Chain zF, Phycobilisome 31.8 kDa linker polypeptide, phy|eukprot:POR9637..scf289_17
MAFVGAMPGGGGEPRAVRMMMQTDARSLSSGSSAAVPFSTAVRFESPSGGLDRYSRVDPAAPGPNVITRFLFKDRPVRRSDPSLSEVDREATMRTVYRNVMGNAYVMEEERAELATLESQFLVGAISTRDFVRGVAKSATYKKRFFESVSQFRFIELNFKHFMGRAPLDMAEMSKHYEIFAAGGYDAEVDSYFDSEEYLDVFGLDTVPYMRFRGTYAPNSTFNLQCRLQGGWARSDKKLPMMSMLPLNNKAAIMPHQIVDGLPVIPNSEHPSQKYNVPKVSREKLQRELLIAQGKANALQIELDAAYTSLASSRAFLAPFAAMAADMDIRPLYGKNPQVFAGQFLGVGAGQWGKTGADTVRGRSRRVAADIGVKEFQLERVKQLVVDLQRALALEDAEADAPATSLLQAYQAKVYVKPPVIAKKKGPEPVNEDEITIGQGDKKIKVTVLRNLGDRTEKLREKPEKEEEEGPRTFKDLYETAKPMKGFPGDGSEMNVGG